MCVVALFDFKLSNMAMSMTQRIESEKKDMKMSEIKNLVLDGCSATEIEGLTDEFSSLESLSIVGAGLTTLAGLPAFPALVKVRHLYIEFNFFVD